MLLTHLVEILLGRGIMEDFRIHPLQRARKKLGMKQQALAELSGLSTATIKRAELDEILSAYSVTQICAFFCEDLCTEIQANLDQEIKMFDYLTPDGQTQQDYLISRKQALTTIAALPAALISWRAPYPDGYEEELLPQCAASIIACWHLLQG